MRAPLATRGAAYLAPPARRAARALAAAFLLLTAGAGVAQGVGAPLPDFTLRDQHGVAFAPADLRGRPWLLNVWASWCPPCRAELPLLARAAADLEGAGLALVLLNAGETAAVARAFLDAEGLDLRTLVDPVRPERGLERTEDLLRRLRARGLPTTFFVDADGVVRASFVGELTADALSAQLEAALGVGWSP